MTLQAFYDYLDTQNIIDDRIVYLRYKYSWEDVWTYANEILEFAEGCYGWLNDWHEGQQEVEILGCVPVSDILVPMFGGEYGQD